MLACPKVNMVCGLVHIHIMVYINLPFILTHTVILEPCGVSLSETLINTFGLEFTHDTRNFPLFTQKSAIYGKTRICVPCMVQKKRVLHTSVGLAQAFPNY